MAFYSNVAGSLLRVKRLHDRAKSSQAEGEEGQNQVMEAAFSEALPQFLQTAWAHVVMDIDGTLKEVGRKLLKDKSVPWQIRVRRAQAMRRLGQIFAEAGVNAGAKNGISGELTSEAAKATLQEAVA